jgi:hypothetical protein
MNSVLIGRTCGAAVGLFDPLAALRHYDRLSCSDGGWPMDYEHVHVDKIDLSLQVGVTHGDIQTHHLPSVALFVLQTNTARPDH